jgi:hypothetical protein
VSAEVRAMARADRPHPLDRLTSWLGASREQALAVARALGFQVRAEQDGTVRVRRARPERARRAR